MTYDQWKTRSPDDERADRGCDIEPPEDGPTELDCVYDDLRVMSSQRDELLAALKLVEPMLKWLRADELADVARVVRDAIEKAERQS